MSDWVERGLAAMIGFLAFVGLLTVAAIGGQLVHRCSCACVP